MKLIKIILLFTAGVILLTIWLQLGDFLFDNVTRRSLSSYLLQSAVTMSTILIAILIYLKFKKQKNTNRA